MADNMDDVDVPDPSGGANPSGPDPQNPQNPQNPPDQQNAQPPDAGSAPESTHYEVLGVTQEADAAAIKAAYDKVIAEKQLAQDSEELKKIEEAYKILSDAAARQEYDKKLAEQAAAKGKAKLNVDADEQKKTKGESLDTPHGQDWQAVGRGLFGFAVYAGNRVITAGIFVGKKVWAGGKAVGSLAVTAAKNVAEGVRDGWNLGASADKAAGNALSMDAKKRGRALTMITAPFRGALRLASMLTLRPAMAVGGAVWGLLITPLIKLGGAEWLRQREVVQKATTAALTAANKAEQKRREAEEKREAVALQKEMENLQKQLAAIDPNDPKGKEKASVLSDKIEKVEGKLADLPKVAVAAAAAVTPPAPKPAVQAPFAPPKPAPPAPAAPAQAAVAKGDIRTRWNRVVQDEIVERGFRQQQAPVLPQFQAELARAVSDRENKLAAQADRNRQAAALAAAAANAPPSPDPGPPPNKRRKSVPG